MRDSIDGLVNGPLTVRVDAAAGGRIIEFSLNGRNALMTTGPEIGSTFWPSPQSAWDWPPPAALDRGPYVIERQQDAIIMTSTVCEITGLQLCKRLEMQENCVKIVYSMINCSDETRFFAPWEISRIGGGVTFYRSSEPPLPISTGAVESIEGVVWHEYRPEGQSENEKIFGNGSAGWLANAYRGLLLVKSFTPVPSAEVAPGEGEIEIYGHGDPKNAYIEIEQQGAYQAINPDEQRHWEVRWFLQALEDKAYVVGDPTLPNRVEALLDQSGAINR